MSKNSLIVLAVVVMMCPDLFAGERRLPQDELRNKLAGFWIGQLVGNFMGFPFESSYVDEPIPVLVDRYYTWDDTPELKIHRRDRRSFLPILASAFEGAYSDDDTDIEFVINCDF